MSDYKTAVDDMFGAVKTDWDAETTAVVGYIPKIYWQGVQDQNKLDHNKFFINVSQHGVNDFQSAFGAATKCYEINGIFMIELFCPLSDAQAMDRGRDLAVIVRDSIRGKTLNGVMMRDVAINESASDKYFLKFIISSNYQYNESV